MSARPPTGGGAECPVPGWPGRPAYSRVGSTAVRRSTYRNGSFGLTCAPERTGSYRPVLAISRARSGPSPSLQRAPRGRRRPDPLEPSVRVACGARPVRSRHPACASAIAVAMVVIAGMVIAVSVADPVSVLLVEPAPMPTDGQAPWGARCSHPKDAARPRLFTRGSSSRRMVDQPARQSSMAAERG